MPPAWQPQVGTFHLVAMSVPHTGKLVATIFGARFHFDGDRWSGGPAQICEQLNARTDNARKHHLSIREVAENVLRDFPGQPTIPPMSSMTPGAPKISFPPAP